MTVSGSYFCACVTRKFRRKLLPLPGRAQDERVADVLDVQVEGVRRVVRRLEDRERLAPQMRADRSPWSSVNRKLRSATLVSSSASRRRLWAPLPGHDAEPRVQQVVGLLEEAAVVCGHRLHRLGRLVLKRAPVRRRAARASASTAEEVAVAPPSRSGSPSWRTVAPAESSTSISSGWVRARRSSPSTRAC